jgi:hypothetical protein
VCFRSMKKRHKLLRYDCEDLWLTRRTEEDPENQ